MKKLISQGAEAKIFLQKNLITKDRIQKKYRHPELDKKLREKRTKSEIKILQKAREIISIPQTQDYDKKNQTKIFQEFINGKKLSENLSKFSLERQKEISKQIGKSIALLHKENIIHSDLTTSNMILKKEKVYFIDFGLGYISARYEDKAVDLYLLKKALEAKHYKTAEILFKEILKQYKKNYSNSDKIFERLKKVEKRGRYKH